MPTTIVTEQAPSAKPINVVLTLNSTFQELIGTVQYDIPVVGLGGQRRIAPGVSEITSPIVLSNTSNQAETVTVRIVKGGSNFVVANEVPVEPNDLVYIPLNGQFLLSETDDKLEITASEDNAITAMISFTQGQAEEDDPFGGV